MENSVQSWRFWLGSRRSLDHSVRSYQHIRRNRQADLLRCYEIDHQLELRRLFHGQIDWLPSFEDFVHIDRGAPVQVGTVRPIGHKAAVFDKFRRVIDRREPALYREGCKLW